MDNLDRGLWISWYDLPEAGRDAYLSWVHESYIPEVLRLPGILWAAHYAEVDETLKSSSIPQKSGFKRTDDPAVPAGSQYILIFGAESADVFGNPVPSHVNANLSEAGKKMLAMRIGERVSIMTETGRVDGPEAKHYPPAVLRAGCIQLGTFNAPWQSEEELLGWYMQARLPSLSTMPGYIRTRKLVSVTGWAKHGVIYECASLKAHAENFDKYKDGSPEMKARSQKFLPGLTHAPHSANLAIRIWPKD